MKKYITLLTVLMLVLCGCSGESAPAETVPAPAEPVVLNMQQIYDSMTAVENAPERVPLDADMQFNFCGIDPADCAQSAVAICSDGLRTDEIWLIEAVDEAALERIQAAAQTRLTAKGEESITYSPEQYAVVQEAQTIVHGNYFAMVVSPDVETLADLFRAAAGI